MLSDSVLLKLEIPPFLPWRICQSGMAQTLAAYWYPSGNRIDNQRHSFIDLPDGDRLAITENTPKQFTENTRTILLVHGLTGSHLSGYMIRTARQFLEEGYRVIRMDLRGCGAGRGMAKQIYHAGRSDDPRQILRWLAQYYPKSPVTVIGFSLGANMILKMAGEDGQNRSGNLDSVIAVSPHWIYMPALNAYYNPKTDSSSSIL